MAAKMVRSAKADRSRGGATRVEVEKKHGSFIGPWLLAVAVLIVGTGVHRTGGKTLPSAALLSVALCGSTAVLTWGAWRYAKPRDAFQRWHVAVSVALAGASIIGFTIFGPVRGLVWLYAIGAVSLCGLWNIRRAEVVRGDGSDGHGAGGGLDEALGLAGSKAKVIEATPERTVSVWTGGPGHTAQDVQKALPHIAAKAGVGRDAVRIVEDAKHAGKALVTIMRKDVLAGTIPWEGAPREEWGKRSIAELFYAGRYEDGEHTVWSLTGDYDKNIPPSHVVVMGITRAGKTVFAILTADQILDCYDAVLWWSDTAKGSQTARPIRDGLDWYTDQPNTVRAQLAALKRVAKARADVLGDAGYSSWTPAAYADPRTRMPALVYWCEEAGSVLDDNPSIVVDLGEVCLSSGIFLIWSLQRASHDRMPTSLRYNIGSAVCYGTGDDVSAEMVLSEATLAAGVDPARWKNRKPGRAVMENAAIEEEKFPVPFKTALPDRGAVAEHVQASSVWRAELDQVSAEAAGETYARDRSPRTSSSAAPPAPAPTAIRRPVAPRMAPLITDLPTSEDDDDEGGWRVPPQPEPDLADMIDPRMPLPPIQGDDVDMRPEDDGKPSLSPADREREFRRMLAELADAGRMEFRMADLVDAWSDQLGPFRANQRPHLHNMLNPLIEAGQVERVEGGGGRYRMVMLVTAGTP